jgi:hypothetical protein
LSSSNDVTPSGFCFVLLHVSYNHINPSGLFPSRNRKCDQDYQRIDLQFLIWLRISYDNSGFKGRICFWFHLMMSPPSGCYFMWATIISTLRVCFHPGIENVIKIFKGLIYSFLFDWESLMIILGSKEEYVFEFIEWCHLLRGDDSCLLQSFQPYNYVTLSGFSFVFLYVSYNYFNPSGLSYKIISANVPKGY